MAATYTPVSLGDIQDVLKAENGWIENALAKVDERVFDWPIPGYPSVVARVYSSGDKRTGMSRKSGRDAIRVCAVDLEADRKSFRWQLKDRLDALELYAKQVRKALQREEEA